MKMLSVKRNIIVLIFAVMLLICGVQGISYGRGAAATVTPGETDTSLIVSFEDSLWHFGQYVYQVQLRRKTPQGDWITKCKVVWDSIYGREAGIYVMTVIFTDLELGTTYEVRYRDTNLRECHDNPPAPDPWSEIAEGMTHLVPPPRVEFADANLATAIREALDLDTDGDHIELLKIPEAELGKLTRLVLTANNISDLTPLAQFTQLTELDLGDNNISDLTPLAQLTQLTELGLGGRYGNNISDLTPLAQLTQLTELDLQKNNISDLTPLAQLTLLTELDLGHNNISDVTPLAQLTQLKWLYLWFNNISDVTPLAQLINLQFLFLSYNDISDFTPLAQLSQRASINAVELFRGEFQPSDIELMTVSTPQPLAEATLNGSSVTLTLLSSGAAYDTLIDNIRNALTVSGIDGVTVSDVTRVSDTDLEVVLEFTGSLENTTALTFIMGAEAVSNYEGRALTGEIPVYETLELSVSANYPLIAATLDGASVTLTLSSGAFNRLRSGIRDAVTISGITGITFHRTNIDRVSARGVTIELTFKGNIETDTILTFTLGAGAIADYNGPALTAEIPVSATTEVELTGELVASTAFPLTKATLDESVVILTLKNNSYIQGSELTVTVSGIDNITVRQFGLDIFYISSKEISVFLNFNGDFDTDATLIFTVPPRAIENHSGPPLSAALPVTVKTGPQALVPESQRPSMYWINTKTDKIESLEPFDAVTQKVASLTVDAASGKIYWAEHGSSRGTIKRANLDGTSVEVLTTPPTTLSNLVVNTTDNKLYWADQEKIQSANLNGGNITTIIELDDDIDDDIKGIAVDAEGGKLYFADLFTIRRVNLDGTNVEIILTGWGTYWTRGIGGIAVADGKIYWTEQQNRIRGSGKIHRANLNGTNIETLATPLGTPTGIAVDTVGGKVYWANSFGGIQRMDINGGEIENVVYGITAPGDFALGAVSTQPTTPTTPEVPNTDSTVSISPSSVASPAVGQQLELSLNITGGETVAGYQATVQFDTTALGYVSSTNGDYLPDVAFFVPPVDGNSVTLNAASLAGESSGGGTLATLTFEVVSVKASTLTLSEVLLVNSAGESFRPQVEEGQITESLQLTGDVNGDGMVNIQDLVLVAGRLGQSGANSADVNGDGSVNIQDLVLVAGALGNTSAAPSLHPHSLEILTAADVKLWLTHAQQLDLTDATSLRGIRFLEQLLAALTPQETALLSNYPNPFNPETWIPYRLAEDAFVTLTIYDGRGQIVRTLDVGHQSAAFYETRSKAIHWDGRNEFGEGVTSGVYFYYLSAGDFSATRKMLIIK